MEQKCIWIDNIPAIIWGPPSDRLLIAVHGDQSNKSDTVIRIVADVANQKGYQVLSFDLPEHGGRAQEKRLCNPENCVEDLARILEYARTQSNSISVFGCSIGAYFTMLAYPDAPIQKALFLSPVVDMKRLINNMMMWFHVSEQQLERERAIATPINTLYWDYYQYVLRHPVVWNKTTALLYGANDQLCEYAYVKAFAEQCHASITVLEDGEHFFHTPKQLDDLQKWLREHLSA